MGEGGSCTFMDAERYQAAFRGSLELVDRPSEFHARLTWIDLPHLQLLRGEESAARIGCVSLPPGSVLITFPTRKAAPLICNGCKVAHGQLMLHSLSEQFYQRTVSPTGWGSISLSVADLADYSRTIHGTELEPPPRGEVLSIPPPDRVDLLRIHAQAGRLAERTPARAAHPEAARALEQEMIWTMVKCLGSGRRLHDPATMRTQSEVLSQFEATITASPHRLLPLDEICERIGVRAETLESLCVDALGMTAERFQYLRRLKVVRSDMARDARPLTPLELGRRYGLTELDTFMLTYLELFGELPLIERSTPARKL